MLKSPFCRKVSTENECMLMIDLTDTQAFQKSTHKKIPYTMLRLNMALFIMIMCSLLSLQKCKFPQHINLSKKKKEDSEICLTFSTVSAETGAHQGL